MKRKDVTEARPATNRVAERALRTEAQPVEAAQPERQQEEGFSVINVRVGVLPGRIKDVALGTEGRTVAAAIEGAAISGGDGFEMRVNGEPARSDQTLREGDTLLLVRKIQGN